MRFSDEFLSEVRDRNDIVDVIPPRIKRQYKYMCPICRRGLPFNYNFRFQY